MSSFRSLLPILFGKNWWDAFEYPSIIMDQAFGALLLNSDLQEPRFSLGRFVQPRTPASAGASGSSRVISTPEEFRVKLDTVHFKPEEVQVKVVGRFVVVQGKHEERVTDGEGVVSREFTRRYMLPEGCEPQGVLATWDPEQNALLITAPRQAKASADRVVPISQPEKAAVKKDEGPEPKKDDESDEPMKEDDPQPKKDDDPEPKKLKKEHREHEKNGDAIKESKKADLPV